MRSLRRRIRRSLRNRSETPTKTRLSTERLPRKKPIKERVLCLSGRRGSVGGGTQRPSVDLSQPEAKRGNLFSCTQEESDMTVATLPVPETNPFLHLPEDVESRLKKLEEKRDLSILDESRISRYQRDFKELEVGVWRCCHADPREGSVVDGDAVQAPHRRLLLRGEADSAVRDACEAERHAVG